MKTIAVTVDEATLTALDAMARRGPPSRGRPRKGAGSRSALVRQALAEFLERREIEERDALEGSILSRHKEKLARQAKALLEEQIEP